MAISKKEDEGLYIDLMKSLMENDCIAVYLEECKEKEESIPAVIFEIVRNDLLHRGCEKPTELLNIAGRCYKRIDDSTISDLKDRGESLEIAVEDFTDSKLSDYKRVWRDDIGDALSALDYYKGIVKGSKIKGEG